MNKLAIALAFVAMSASAEPMRVTAYTPAGELQFLGIYDVTFKPNLVYERAYACTINNKFRASINCVRNPKGDKDIGRYCVKPDRKSDLMCSKPIMVETLEANFKGV